MDTRKIQRSGATYYVYLPASWCRENKITTKSKVRLSRSSSGGLVINTDSKRPELPSLSLELEETTPEVINKITVASYINPVKKFDILLKDELTSRQILAHKKILGGLELIEFDSNSISCNTTITLENPKLMISTMIKKMISSIRLIKEAETPELIEKYEEEIDKSNLMIRKSIISSLMYKKDTELRHIDLFYIGMLSRTLEQVNDILIKLDKEEKILDNFLVSLKRLEEVLNNLNQQSVISYIKQLSRFEKIHVKDEKTFYRERIVSLLAHIGEIFSDWLISNEVDKDYLLSSNL
ncbi:hypothetical protein JW930_07255 [Candidatus Woesearchaeota archaeon]|nr:hypothetical protein [Candidatus Woesearchaeota archaeon]